MSAQNLEINDIQGLRALFQFYQEERTQKWNQEIVLIFGKRESGKSSVIRQLLGMADNQSLDSSVAAYPSNANIVLLPKQYFDNTSSLSYCECPDIDSINVFDEKSRFNANMHVPLALARANQAIKSLVIVLETKLLQLNRGETFVEYLALIGQLLTQANSMQLGNTQFNTVSSDYNSLNSAVFIFTKPDHNSSVKSIHEDLRNLLESGKINDKMDTLSKQREACQTALEQLSKSNSESDISRKVDLIDELQKIDRGIMGLQGSIQLLLAATKKSNIFILGSDGKIEVDKLRSAIKASTPIPIERFRFSIQDKRIERVSRYCIDELLNKNKALNLRERLREQSDEVVNLKSQMDKIKQQLDELHVQQPSVTNQEQQGRINIKNTMSKLNTQKEDIKKKIDDNDALLEKLKKEINNLDTNEPIPYKTMSDVVYPQPWIESLVDSAKKGETAAALLVPFWFFAGKPLSEATIDLLKRIMRSEIKINYNNDIPFLEAKYQFTPSIDTGFIISSVPSKGRFLLTYQPQDPNLSISVKVDFYGEKRRVYKEEIEDKNKNIFKITKENEKLKVEFTQLGIDIESWDKISKDNGENSINVHKKISILNKELETLSKQFNEKCLEKEKHEKALKDFEDNQRRYQQWFYFIRELGSSFPFEHRSMAHDLYQTIISDNLAPIGPNAEVKRKEESNQIQQQKPIPIIFSIDPKKDNEKKLNKDKKSIWQKPITWIFGGTVAGVAAAYFYMKRGKK